jgi:hypothetical protein
MSALANRKRVIAFDVRSRSFAFAIFEGPNELVDFGVRSFRRGANAVQVPPREKLAALFDEFNSMVAVRRDSLPRESKWKLRIDDALLQESREHRIPIRYVTRRAVKKVFLGHNGNKHAIATALAQRFPAFAAKLPPKRKCWQSEDYRMSVFDAAALGVGYFNQLRPTRLATEMKSFDAESGTS